MVRVLREKKEREREREGGRGGEREREFSIPQSTHTCGNYREAPCNYWDKYLSKFDIQGKM